jgi:FlaA1/EpsC-like NDP-sugar epimerase
MNLIAHLAHHALGLPRYAKRSLAVLADISLCVLTVWVAYFLRLGEWVSLSGHPLWHPLWAVGVSVAIALPIFIAQGFYRAIFRYSGWPALITVARAMAVYGLVYAATFTAIRIDGVPRTIGIIQPMLLLIAVGASRVFARYWLGGMYRDRLKRAAVPKALVYGAGSAGRQLVAAMVNSHELRVVGFLDDDDRLRGHVLDGQPIHAPVDLPHLVTSLNVTTVLLAMPSITRKRRNEIITRMLDSHVSVRTLPSVGELAQGKVGITDIRELDIDDLLGRDPVVPNHLLLSKTIAGKVVVVTGAGGSIGSELCRQIQQLGPTHLLLIEQSEFALYAIHQELEEKLSGRAIRLVPLLASVQDAQRMHEIFSTWRPHIVYHAAAYKHVPLVEHNPAEGIRNNVFGTLVAAQAAAANGVSEFVLISTDKAVRPTNVMGASKRLAEMLLLALAATRPATTFTMVRFGNVLGSSGSVVPKFRQQLRNGGPITVTHREVTRYFMTISEAAQLVIQAAALARGGDVFLLDMGQPVKIFDLARRIVELSGLSVKDDNNPDGDIEIQITGLRPGEKLYEELLLDDNAQATSHPRIKKALDEAKPWSELEQRLDALQAALAVNDVERVRSMLLDLVSGYAPSGEIVDWVHLETDAAALRAGAG